MIPFEIAFDLPYFQNDHDDYDGMSQVRTHIIDDRLLALYAEGLLVKDDKTFISSLRVNNTPPLSHPRPSFRLFAQW